MQPSVRIGVIGAGILGLATARELLRRMPRAHLVVIEKETEVATHQSGRNSGVVHSGLYYPEGSLKAKLCVDGVRALRDLCIQRDLPYVECGKVIVATSAAAVPQLERLARRGTANGVPDLSVVDRHGLRDIEPQVRAHAALVSPTTAITDFRQVSVALAEVVRELGGALALGARVTGIDERGGETVVTTTAGEHVFDVVVNCAGLHADRVARLSGDGDEPRIVPFRGDFWRLTGASRQMVRGLVYPLPDPAYPFLGIHVTKTVDGGVLLGPNAVVALARDRYARMSVRPRDVAETLMWPGFWRLARRHLRQGARELTRSMSKRRFLAEARQLVPALRAEDLAPAPSGTRAQALERDGTLVDDFRFSYRGRTLNVRNAPSPAATSSLAIAQHIADEVEALGLG